LFFRSLRFRLTLWYTLALAVILAASGLFWHMYLSRQLHILVDERLLLIAEEVSSFHFAAHDGFSMMEPPGADHCEKLEIFIRSHNWGSFVQVVNGRGSIACSSSNLKTFHLPLDKAALQNAAQGRPHFETVRTLTPAPLRLLTFPIIMQGRVTDLVQVGESLEQVEGTLEHLRLILLTFSPLAIAALSIGGWFLAGRALAPVVRISRAARKINAENLYQRLPTTGTQDEIAQLAETFNSMLARLENSFDKVRQFTGDASHELRTPLAILKGETEVALRWAKEPEELRGTLESNLEEINRMDRILEDLLALARSEAGELHLNIVEFSLSDMLQDLYLQGRTLGAPKNISVSLNLQVTEEIRLEGDQLQLTRMFLNLVTNAIKYTPEGGQVSISLAVRGHEAVVAVADTGIGIAREHLAHIFDRFYRVDEARNRQVGGTGLGLAIVKSIIDAHGGRIDVESAPDQGSEFTVYLPLAGPHSTLEKAGR
jgi:heavy metal sensor kinase